MKEKDMLGGVLDEIGDVSGWTALDMGSGPCSMVASLTERIGDGRVFAVDLFKGVMNSLKKTLSDDLLLKVVFIKADLRRLDFLRDAFVDLVTAYDTLSVVEQVTPGGTPYVLNEARRILKPGSWFVVIEHWPVETIEAMDKAEEVEVRWWRVHMEIAKALGETTGVEYTMDLLRKTLTNAGFIVSHWREVERGEVEPGEKFIPYIIEKAKGIPNKVLREKVLIEMKSIEEDGKKYGMRRFPRYVVYAKNPTHGRLKKLKPLPLKDLYRTTHLGFV